MTPLGSLMGDKRELDSAVVLVQCLQGVMLPMAGVTTAACEEDCGWPLRAAARSHLRFDRSAILSAAVNSRTPL